MSVSVVRVENLTKIYGTGDNQIHALRGINLSIEQGDFVAIMGPSGSGKSTLLHLIGGLDQPTSGSIWLGDTDISTLNDKALSRLRRQKIGFIFQFFNLMPTLTARENVALPLILDRVNRKTAFERADDELKILGMADRANHRPSRLSGGQQQRVSIARAMIIKPMLLLGDEPTGALDTRTGTEVAELLRKVASDWHHTVIIVTHNPRIAAYADRIVYLKDGTIVDDNQLDEKQPSASEIHQQLSRVVAN